MKILRPFINRLTLLLIPVISMFLFHTSSASEKSGCKKCHLDVYNFHYTYPHIPFQNGDCNVCHIAGSVPIDSSSGIKKKEEWEKITSDEYTKEHMVILPDLKTENTYLLRIKGQGKNGSLLMVPVKEFTPSKIPEMENKKSGPVGSEIIVDEIIKGVFTEATITWRTDIPATSRIEYGPTGRFDQETPLSVSLVKNHRSTLYDLEEGVHYQFRIKSSDYFGNTFISPTYTLTEKVPSSETKKKIVPPRSSPELSGKIELFRIEPSRIVMFWETNINTSTCAEWKKLQAKNTINGRNNGSSKKLKIHGAGRNNDKAAGIDACYICHPLSELGASHPVGVYPKDDMKIPEDLPTGEGGMLTCVTCHYPHGSSRPYLGRRIVQQELCKSCHGKKY